jgi:GNAT superfamily N-acetyltransferase
MEMTAADQLRPSKSQSSLIVQKAPLPDPARNRDFYLLVGRSCVWWERLSWGWSDWLAYVNSERVDTHIATLDGEVCGFLESVSHGDGEVEIALFGLLPGFVGKGHGGYFLSEATKTLWESGANRIWLSTSTMDNANALPNYEARGFRCVDVQRSWKRVPATLGLPKTAQSMSA